MKKHVRVLYIYIYISFISCVSKLSTIFLPTKTHGIYTSNSFVARAVRNLGWHRQNWHRSSRYSPELAYMVSKNIGSDGSEIQPVMENLPFFVVVRWKKTERLVEMEGIFHPLKNHVISTPLLPGKTWHETFPSPGWWIPTNRKSGWFQIHPRKSTWNLKMKVRKMIFTRFKFS